MSSIDSLSEIVLSNVKLPAEDEQHIGQIVHKVKRVQESDATFANPAPYRVLEEEGYLCAIRLKANAVLVKEVEHPLARPAGRPSRKPKMF